jgi:hypothetical protein
VILFGKKNEYEEYNDRNRNVIHKWLELRLRVLNKLVAGLPDIAKRQGQGQETRAEFIERLVGLFDSEKAKIQIIIEEIPVFTKEGLNDWYASTLLHTKYDYIDGLSDNFVDNGTELFFTQYLVKKRIPNHILYYHEANPNIIHDIHDDAPVNYENIYDNLRPKTTATVVSKSPSKKHSVAMPRIFEGELNGLNSKWTKYKKKIWWQLRYVKNDYVPVFITELFDYFKSVDNDIVNDYHDIIKKTFRYYTRVFSKANDFKNIKSIFKDPHFYSSYVNAMNLLNGTKKTFKTLEIFLTSYFYNSSVAERVKILKQMSDPSPNEITFFMISKVLNISILIIHSRAEYGKAVDVSKRADEKDLAITTSIYKADTNELDRPLLILYRMNDKTHLSYYVIRNANPDIPIYTDLKDAPDEIKTMILATNKTSTYSSSSSTRTSNI